MTKTASNIDAFHLVYTFFQFLQADETSGASRKEQAISADLNQVFEKPQFERTPLERLLLSDPIKDIA